MTIPYQVPPQIISDLIANLSINLKLQYTTYYLLFFGSQESIYLNSTFSEAFNASCPSLTHPHWFNYSQNAKSTANYIAYPLKLLFDKSISTNEVPNDWKHSNVIPIPKTSPPSSSSSDYLPIYLLSLTSKLLEKHIFHICLEFSFQHSLISENKFGILHQHSTTLLYNLIQFQLLFLYLWNLSRSLQRLWLCSSWTHDWFTHYFWFIPLHFSVDLLLSVVSYSVCLSQLN